MTALKILIIEDEFVAAEALHEKLLQFGYTVTGVAADSDEALQSFQEQIPDMVLCDIDLKNSPLDGIEVAKEFKKIEEVPIIFLTAYGDSATVQRAKPLNPAYYLIKPCNTTQLQIAIDFAIANFTQQQIADPKHSLQFQTPPACNFYSKSDSFFIRKGTMYARLQVAEIIWVEAMSSNVKIVTEEKTHILSANLSSFYNQVQHPALIRVHRSYLLNARKVESFHAGAAFVTYQGGRKEIPIGATYRDKFQETFPRLISD